MQASLVWGCVVLIVLLLALNLWRKSRNLPPGPWGLPFLGYYPFLGDSFYVKFSKMVKNYGSVMSFRTFGGKLIVVLNGLDVIKEVFYTRAEEFIGRPLEYNLVYWVSDGLGIAQEEGPSWKEQRKFFLAKAKDFGFGKTEAEGLMHELLQEMIRDFKDLKGKPFPLLTHVSHVTTNVIGEILFKKQLRKDDPQFLKISNGLHEMVSIFTEKRSFLLGPFMRYFVLKCTNVGRLSEETKKVMISAAKEIVDEHVKTFDPRHLRDFVDAYLDQMRILEGKGKLYDSSFTRKRLEAVVMNMWLEGTESVASSICNLLVAIANYPDVQRKVQEEMDSVIEPDRLPSWVDKPNLPYFDAVISELYRMHQPFFNSTMYSNFEETTLRGYKIPKRSVVIANFWSVNFDPKTHSDPEIFNPDRFLGPDKKRLKQDGITPFGIGKRSCIGESLAQMEVFIVIGTILQHFTLYTAQGETNVRAVARTDT